MSSQRCTTLCKKATLFKRYNLPDDGPCSGNLDARNLSALFLRCRFAWSFFCMSPWAGTYVCVCRWWVAINHHLLNVQTQPKIMYHAAHNFTTQPILVQNAQSLCPTPSIGDHEHTYEILGANYVHKSRYADQCPKLMYRAAHNFTTQPILVRNAQSLCPTPSIGN